MKNQDKHYLKALLLASMSSIGITASHAAGTSGVIARKEREGSDTSTEMVSEALTSGVLESHPSFGEVLGHTSHTAHGSHVSHSSHTSSSHASHSSHTSSSGYGGGSSDNKKSEKIAVITVGGIYGAIILTYLVKYIIKKHKKRVALRKAEKKQYHAYATRDLSSGIYGNDVDLMTDLLIENGALKQHDRKFSHRWSHYKYNGKVKHSVKRMQTLMGQKRTGKASKIFLMDLQQWKETRKEFAKVSTIDSLNLMEDRNALQAVAILLVEKGFLKSYNADNIMSNQEKSKIVEAYHDFQRSNHLPETSLIDEQMLRLLMSLANKQNEII